jgi:DNA-binding transcriptional regulator YhcF (GntR family)
MFRVNKKHFQVTLFGMLHQLPMGVKKKLDKSWAPAFRKLIFEKIDENRYAVLYSTVESRPNFPVNIWVGLEILKEMFDYTDQELMEQFHFNFLTAYALGQDNLGEVTLCDRTIYYNRERLLEYEDKTGCNLLQEEFKAITDKALAELKINAKIQRMDSSFVGSFIKQMSRLELIARVLQNFYHDLPEAEQIRWHDRLGTYIKEEAEHLAYQMKRAEVEKQLKELGGLLFELHQAYAGDEKLSAGKSYRQMSRILLEQYRIAAGAEQIAIEVKPAQEISSNSLQNPADETATFRRKDGEGYKGEILNVAETCAPENKVQLLTDISVYQNVAADDVILADRISALKERTGLEELITDGNYSGERSESACQTENVSLIPTDIKGCKLSADEVSLAEFHFEEKVIVSCPEGQSPLEQIYKPEKSHHIVHFAKEECAVCVRAGNCPVNCRQKFTSLLYNDRQVVLARRRQQLGEEEYCKKCRLRPAVEGTISQFKRLMQNGKLRVRGEGRIRNNVILMAIGINFKRLWAYIQENSLEQALLLSNTIIFLRYLVLKWLDWIKILSLCSI